MSEIDKLLAEIERLRERMGFWIDSKEAWVDEANRQREHAEAAESKLREVELQELSYQTEAEENYQRRREAEAEVARLRAELARLRAEVRQLRSENLRKIDDGLETSDALIDTLNHLEAVEVANEAQEQELARLRAECADRESERADLRDRLTKAEAEVDAMPYCSRVYYQREKERAEKAEAAVARVEALAEKWSSATQWDSDTPHIVTRAYGHELRIALAGGGDE